jgi:hypothetical protein
MDELLAAIPAQASINSLGLHYCRKWLVALQESAKALVRLASPARVAEAE